MVLWMFEINVEEQMVNKSKHGNQGFFYFGFSGNQFFGILISYKRRSTDIFDC